MRSKRTIEPINKKTFKRVLARLFPFRLIISIIMGCFLLVTILTFFRPLIIEKITDEGMLKKDLSVILYFSLILLALVVIEEVVEVIQNRYFVRLQNKIEFSLYEESFQKLLHLDMEYFSRTNNAEIINRVTTDIDRVGMIADQGVMFMFHYILSIISGFVGLLVINWKLALLVMAVVPIKYVIAKILAKRKKKLVEELIENSRDFSSWFGDNINGIREIKLWNLYSPQLENFKRKQKILMGNTKENAMLDAYNMGMDSFLEGFITCILYVVGGILIIRNELTIGGVIAFLSYSRYVTGPISALLNMKLVFAGILPSAKRLFEFLDSKEETGGNQVSLETEEFNKLIFDHVSFSYGNILLLNDVDFLIKKGEKIAIIGQNGSGKTTIINLLLRFINPVSGSIRVNGTDIHKYNMNVYRNLFSVVSQDPFLFQDTVKNNIDLRKVNQIEDIQDACWKSGISQFISKLEEGLDSKIGRNGAKISGGERQKIAVARAIVKNAPIVILDEATSNFDVGSDAFLHQIIANEFQEKTVILITHRYENLKGMDRVYKLENGRLYCIKDI